jgi:hypothetical protein
MPLQGRRIKIDRWIHADRCVLRVSVDALIPDADSSEPCLEPATIRMLDDLQRKADQGLVDELAKVGDVYVRQFAA